MTDERDVLSALMDREAVDPAALARVLDDPAGRSLLVDFVRLRNDVAAGAPGTESVSLTELAPPRSRDMGSLWRIAAAFLLLAIGTAGGAWLEQYRSRERPPEPDRIVALEPVAPSEK